MNTTKLHTFLFTLFKGVNPAFLKVSLIPFFALSLPLEMNAQEETVIDHKGTLTTVRNNVVSSGITAPATPLEGDIWFDTTDASNPIISVWNGTAWQEIKHNGTAGSLFFANASGEPTEDNTQLFWDDTNNRLGIGTNSLINKLQVAGAIRSQGILNSDGTAGEPSYRFSNNTNTGIYSPAADELGFSVGGIEALNIDETSSSTTVTVNETLDLDGPVLDENDSQGTAGQILSATATGTDWIDAATGGGTVSGDTDNSLTVGTDSGIFYESPLKAFGKIRGIDGTILSATGIASAVRTSEGEYSITLTNTLLTADYIIQLSMLQPVGSNRIASIIVIAQNTSSFDVEIVDMSNANGGGGNKSPVDLDWYFTVIQ